ncbi:stage V sporulation protein D [Clostridium sp. D2Q-14]|uniref:peptidoglycan D,D-transpeptidase FtsI family protein n=1 Tax=Anaeromonas gelatinilytica TaxID=2683194 RepID=UPI00193C76F4|nr:penicillin-binding transpeptidase domain-containing protein [Anaeromonas gelatinilytica]MBS4534587.1 stage V sporulation protein D [Anaeromonas gelatinilytica]
MESFKKLVKNRLILIAIFVSLLIFILIIRLGYLQIVKKKTFSTKAVQQWTRDIVLNPQRGYIYDRNGKKIATNISLYTISVIPNQIDEKDYDKYIERISKILELEEEKVETAIKSEDNWVEIERDVDREKAELLKKEKLEGISIDETSKRYYHFGNFLAQVLGNTNRDGVGQYGIERYFNEELMGTPGRWIKTVDGNRMELPYNYQKKYEEENGKNLVLTIDETIQYHAENAAKDALKENEAKNASVIVMDPKTGDILAMASKPDYDPNERMNITYDSNMPWINLSEEQILEFSQKSWEEKQDELYDMWKNPLISDVYEPGSTFKILLLAASLEEGIVDLNETFYCDGKVTEVPGNITCLKDHGIQTLSEGIQNSCNEVAVQLGLRLGKETLNEYIRAFGMGEPTGIELPSEIGGLLKDPKSMEDVDLATMAFGQGIAVTPLQLINSVSSIANDGKLMKPNIVKSIIDDEGNELEKKEVVYTKQVISKETAQTVLDILEEVVSEGSGRNAYIPGYRVGGKTGTAQKAVDGKYISGKYVSSFIGVAPIDDPKVVVLTIIDEPNPKKTYYGSTIAAPVAKNVIEDTLTYLNVPREEEKDED